ncbi:hypothetical protein NDN08_002774 [Rhodosorus marinus]|uniref:Uncharacterized protein n=1 Tax=Rhodosorus marinus TaxID=101924 RepID=A0AAV8V0G0_9RHOD|nr:hypothetical protein NDN08_002774 [Rhodosorus marinus]
MLSLLGSVLCDSVVTITSSGTLAVFDSSDMSSSTTPIQTISDPDGEYFTDVHRYKNYVYTNTNYANVQRWGISSSGKLYRTSDKLWFQYCPSGLSIRGSSDPEHADYVLLICPYYSYGNSRVILANPKTLEFEHTIPSIQSGMYAATITDAVLTDKYLYTSQFVPHSGGVSLIMQYDVSNNFKKGVRVNLPTAPRLSIMKNSDLFATYQNQIGRFDADTMETLKSVYDVSGSDIDPVCESDIGGGAGGGMVEFEGSLYASGNALTRYTLADNGCPVSSDAVEIDSYDIAYLPTK